MAPFFCFTLDTEPDDLWAKKPTLSFDHFTRLNDFHKRMAGAGAHPTYLTTSEVAEFPEAARALENCMAASTCEIGAHFHTWTRSWPFQINHPEFPRIGAMAHQLGQETEEAMLATTCDALERAFGSRPRSHRGGRWSLGKQTALSLRNCGIHVDSTSTPGITWQDTRSQVIDGPDFRRWPKQPHLLSDVFGPGEGRDEVVEIPVGSAWLPAASEKLPPFLGRQFERAGNLLGVSLGYRWLRPTYMSLAGMTAALESLKQNGVPVWVAMIHSSEIAPCTPLPNETVVKAFIDRCVGVAEAAIRLGAKPATLTAAARAIFPSLASLTNA